MNGENEKNEQFNALIFLTLCNDMLCCLERYSEFKNRKGPLKLNSLELLMVQIRLALFVYKPES